MKIFNYRLRKIIDFMDIKGGDIIAGVCWLPRGLTG